MVGKAQKLHRARSEMYGWCSDGVPPISVSTSIATFQRNAEAPLRFQRHPKRSSFKTTINSIFEKWVDCKKCTACQGRYFEKETVTAPLQISDSE
jgi:hypothetical protein